MFFIVRTRIHVFSIQLTNLMKLSFESLSWKCIKLLSLGRKNRNIRNCPQFAFSVVSTNPAAPAGPRRRSDRERETRRLCKGNNSHFSRGRRRASNEKGAKLRAARNAKVPREASSRAATAAGRGAGRAAVNRRGCARRS